MTTALPYQKKGVRIIRKRFGCRAILADEMGLGKTYQAIQVIVKEKDFPAVIVCPAFLKRHWSKELWRHGRLKCTVLNGMKFKRALIAGHHNVIVVNYDILDGWVKWLKSLQPRIVCGDEIHLIGNLKSLRGRLFRHLCKEVPHVLALSGTPLMNRPWELFPILNVLRPDRFSSPFAFGTTFCEVSRDFGKWRFSGAKNLDKLHRRLKKLCMVRRTKDEVLSDLPPLRVSVLPLDIEQRSEYDYAEREFICWLTEEFGADKAAKAARAERYTRFTYLKQLAAKLKMKGVKDWIKSALAADDGKLLVGAIHRQVLNDLHQAFPDSVVIHGGKTDAQRAKAEEAFLKDSKVRILFGQEKAAGVGLNLQVARRVALVELPWNPATAQQFIARAHRLTSTHPVDAYFLVAHGTIEDTMCRIIERKNKTLDRVLDGVSSQGSTLDLLQELQQALLKKSGG